MANDKSINEDMAKKPQDIESKLESTGELDLPKEKLEAGIDVQTVVARVITAAVEAPKIVTGNYSALMACLNDILTNTVTIASDSEHLRESPIYLIAEPMWLDSVDKSYDHELWGQSIDAFPSAVQKFAKERVKPAPNNGEKLTWGQVRDLRSAMLECIKKTDGFTVYEGEIKKVEEGSIAESDTDKELKIHFLDGNNITIPFTGQPVVLDLSQRPRPAGHALSGDPTVLYRYSREVNETKLSDVPIIVAGAGAQAAWVLDKMGDKRTYNISYNSTLDFRIANAILGSQEYTAANGNVAVNHSPLKEALAMFANGAPKLITYTKDDGKQVSLNVAVYPNNKAKLIRALDIPSEPIEANSLLKGLGIKEADTENVLSAISAQIEKRYGQDLGDDQLTIKLFIDPPSVDVGFAVNATGWVALKDTIPLREGSVPFWGRSAKVSTGEELVRAANLVTPSSLLPGSGLPRALAMTSHFRFMRVPTVKDISYDVRTLAFTQLGFDKMCEECKFPPNFKAELQKAIKKLGTPEDAQPNPVAWILEQYGTWLESNPPIVQASTEEAESSKGQEKTKGPTKEELINQVKEVARSVLNENILQNETAEKRAIM